MVNEGIGSRPGASAEEIDTAMKLGANHPMGTSCLREGI